jgi:hypothetical protein
MNISTNLMKLIRKSKMLVIEKSNSYRGFVIRDFQAHYQKNERLLLRTSSQ